MRYIFLVAVIFLIGCTDENLVFEQNVEIPSEEWAVNDKAQLDVLISDTISQHNFLINVRNTEAYPYRNLYVFVKTTFPNGKTAKDTVGLILADATGRWVGSGSGYLSSSSHHTNSIMYSYNKRFPMSGNYQFEIEQAMRTDTLVGVRSIGLRIEKTR